MQSSALPLGHAANTRDQLSLADRISHNTETLLFLSNGHGEDLIALQILKSLHHLRPAIGIEVLPLVGEGNVFNSAVAEGWLKKVGPSIRLPSGGFGNQSLKGLILDLFAGLAEVTWEQWLLIQDSARRKRVIVAVGDLLPLFLAWASGASFAFIGTPKSDYTWMSGPGYAVSDYYHCLKGTEWDPWEYALMRSNRCKTVAVRDCLTARGLRKHQVNAYFLGNPMMDGLHLVPLPKRLKSFRRLLLLCGSRVPEAQDNFQRLIKTIELVESETPIAILVALGSDPSVIQLEALLADLGYKQLSFRDDEKQIGAQSIFGKGSCNVFLGSGKFSVWAAWAEVGLATAGTATEQLVGLGIPALSLPGAGPQFKLGFAIRQSRLLGGAVMPFTSQVLLAKRLNVLLADARLRNQLGKIGSKRMGPSGGSAALSSLISKLLLAH